MQPGTKGGEDVGRAAMRQALGAFAGLLGVGVVAVDPEGRCWFRSQRWEDRSGTGGRAHGPWHEGVHPDDRDQVAARWQSLLGRRGRLGTFRVTSADGVVHACRGESVPMVGTDGKVHGHLIVITDADGPSADGGAGGRDRAPVLTTPHLLDAVLAGAPDLITILNPDGSWRWSSGAALRLLGHQAEFDARDGLFRLLHPDDVPVAIEAFTRAVAGDVAPDEGFELRVRAADGSWRLMEGTLDVLLDDPSVRGVVVHTRDVTDRRQALDALEASNRRLADVISSMKTALLVEDEHGAVVLVNQAFVNLFRLSVRPEEMVGRTLASVGLTVARVIVDPPDAAERMAALRHRGQRVETARAVLFDGRTIEVDFVPTRAQGNDRGNLWAVRDISRRARAEAERERLLASEQEENRRLAEMDAFRTESIAAVSHELRTPLTSIVGYTQLLRNMIDAGRNPEEIECVDAIARNVDRLLRLAGDVVALDSLESRTLPLAVASVDIVEVLRQASASLAPAAAAKSITVDVDGPRGRPLYGDADRLVQLFENLLSNAVKFTPAEGRISITARTIGREWLVEVADTGIGIPEDEVELLFGRYFRASNARTRGIPGSGLGLSVARAIVERHRGAISVRSSVGAGTTVTIRLGDAPEHEASGDEAAWPTRLGPEAGVHPAGPTDGTGGTGGTGGPGGLGGLGGLTP